MLTCGGCSFYNKVVMSKMFIIFSPFLVSLTGDSGRALVFLNMVMMALECVH